MVSTVASSSFLSIRPSMVVSVATTPSAPPKLGRPSCSVFQQCSISLARPAVVESRQSPPSGSSGRTPCQGEGLGVGIVEGGGLRGRSKGLKKGLRRGQGVGVGAGRADRIRGGLGVACISISLMTVSADCRFW